MERSTKSTWLPIVGQPLLHPRLHFSDNENHRITSKWNLFYTKHLSTNTNYRQIARSNAYFYIGKYLAKKALHKIF